MPAFSHLLDTSGQRCPIPLLKAKKQMNSLAAGEVLKVISTDKGSQADFKVFCQQTGYALLAIEQQGAAYHIFVKKVEKSACGK